MTHPTSPPTEPTPSESTDSQSRLGLWIGLSAIIAIVAGVALFAPRDETAAMGGWVTMWIIAAVLLAVGEMVTAGFFLFPFAVGAAAASVLAMFSVVVLYQFITFAVISVLALWLTHRFASKDIHGELLPVGAARYIGQTVLVLEPISRLHGTGMVKLGMQDWRATTDGDEEISQDSEVTIVEVRGARLVVEPLG